MPKDSTGVPGRKWFNGFFSIGSMQKPDDRPRAGQKEKKAGGKADRDHGRHQNPKSGAPEGAVRIKHRIEQRRRRGLGRRNIGREGHAQIIAFGRRADTANPGPSRDVLSRPAGHRRRAPDAAAQTASC